MSAPNVVILALFCVKLSSGQGLVYRPTDLPTDRLTDQPTNMSKAIYPHFVEGGGIIKCNKMSVRKTVMPPTATLIQEVAQFIY